MAECRAISKNRHLAGIYTVGETSITSGQSFAEDAEVKTISPAIASPQHKGTP